MIKFVKIVGVIAVLLITAFLLLRTPDTDPAAMRAKYGGAPSQFVTLDIGQTVHLRDEGPRGALPIILLHGANSSLHTWEPWAAALTDTYRVIRFDQVGHGLTGPANDGDYRKARYVADVERVADHLGLGNFIIGGNSMGGWVAAAYAIEHPGRVRGLALLDASGAPRRDDEGGLYLGAVIAGIPVVNTIMTAITPRSLVRSSYEDTVADPALITDETVDRYWELLRYPGNRQAVLDRANTSRGGPFAETQIAALTMPSLVMWGERDMVTPLSGARWYAEHLPGAKVITYADLAHLPMEEDPARTVANFISWIEANVSEAQVRR